MAGRIETLCIIDRDHVLINGRRFISSELLTQSNASNTLKALTNADRIRSMKDEELAKWMAKYCERKTVFCPNFGAHDCQESCEQCWLDWLRTEVTE